MALADLQKRLLEALLADDPLAELTRVAPELRVDRDGFALTSLMVKKLRFERLFRGDKDIERWFKEDPEGFTKVFRDYHRDVPATAYFPQSEGEAFRDWCRRNSRGPGGV